MAVLSYDGNIQGDITAAESFMDEVDKAIGEIEAQLETLSSADVWQDANSSQLISDANQITTEIKTANTNARQAANDYLNAIKKIIENAYSFK